MALLSLDDFAGALGGGWEMEVNGARSPAELIEASPLPDSGREGGSFRLEFRGPVDPAYAQGLFAFHRDGTSHEIFVTARSRDDAGTIYEAIFF